MSNTLAYYNMTTSEKSFIVPAQGCSRLGALLFTSVFIMKTFVSERAVCYRRRCFWQFCSRFLSSNVVFFVSKIFQNFDPRIVARSAFATEIVARCQSYKTFFFFVTNARHQGTLTEGEGSVPLTSSLR